MVLKALSFFMLCYTPQQIQQLFIKYKNAKTNTSVIYDKIIFISFNLFIGGFSIAAKLHMECDRKRLIS